jgi:hypothetical protein
LNPKKVTLEAPTAFSGGPIADPRFAQGSSPTRRDLCDGRAPEPAECGQAQGHEFHVLVGVGVSVDRPMQLVEAASQVAQPLDAHRAKRHVQVVALSLVPQVGRCHHACLSLRRAEEWTFG